MKKRQQRTPQLWVLHISREQALDHQTVHGHNLCQARTPDLSDTSKRYDQMELGDLVIFVPDDVTMSYQLYQVAHRSSKYSSLSELFDNHLFRLIDPRATEQEEVIEKISQYHGYRERIQKHGVYFLEFDQVANLDMKQMVGDIIMQLPLYSGANEGVVNLIADFLQREPGFVVALTVAGLGLPVLFTDGRSIMFKNRLPDLETFELPIRSVLQGKL